MEQIRESMYPDNYRREETEYILQNCRSGDSVLVISFPGCGKSSFLRFLLSNPKIKRQNPNLKLLYVDLNQLPRYETTQLYKLILRELNRELNVKTLYSDVNEELYLLDEIKESINQLTKRGQKVVMIMDRFDKVFAYFPQETFNILRSIRDEFRNSFLFTVTTPTDPANITSLQKIMTFYHLVVPSTLFIKPFNETDCRAMIKVTSEGRGIKFSLSQTQKIMEITGRHATLVKSFIQAFEDNNKIKFEPEALLSLHPVKIVLTEIMESLNNNDLRVVKELVNNEAPTNQSALSNLLNLGIVYKDGKTGYRMFSPTFELHLKAGVTEKSHKVEVPVTPYSFKYDENKNTVYKREQDLSGKLSKQESDLLKYLVVNSGRVCKRDEVASIIWGNSSLEGVTDEAIDQVVSRLRSKIEDGNKPQYLITLRGVGFRFDNPFAT